MNDRIRRENFVVHVMNAGFERAANSFAKFIGKDVQVTNTKSFLIRHDDDFSYISEEEGLLYVLVTEVIGSLYGKSYLIFNETETQVVNQLLSTAEASMKDAILMELDNIISASVISELSNALKLSIYGDVPNLKKMHAIDLQEFIRADSNEKDPASIILTNTTFLFDRHQEIHPQFIWKLSTSIFDKVPAEQVAVPDK